MVKFIYSKRPKPERIKGMERLYDKHFAHLDRHCNRELLILKLGGYYHTQARLRYRKKTRA